MRPKATALWSGIAFVLPATLLFILVVYYPFVQSIYYSFTQWDSIRKPVFIGLDNYKALFQDAKMLQALKNTLFITVFGITIQNSLALWLAILLNRPFRTKHFLRTAFYAPVIVSLVVTSIVWGNLLQYDGLINTLLSKAGLDDWIRDWLGSIYTSFPTIVVISQWQALGFCAIIYLAGLQSIPAELYESARIDGAHGMRLFRHITLPMLMPVITIVIFITIVGGLKLFDLPYALTNGGPGYSSYTLSLAIYNSAFRESMYGYATAGGIVLMLFIMFITLIQLRLTRDREVEA